MLFEVSGQIFALISLLMTLHIRRDGKLLSWIKHISFRGLQRLASLLHRTISWISTRRQSVKLFSHQDQAHLLSAAEDLLPLIVCLGGFLRLRATVLTKVIFKGGFHSDGGGRGESSRSLQHSPLLLWGDEGGVGLELHNGCLSELTKREMFHPFCVGYIYSYIYVYMGSYALSAFEPGRSECNDVWSILTWTRWAQAFVKPEWNV